MTLFLLATAVFAVGIVRAEGDQSKQLFLPSVYSSPSPPAIDCNIPNTNYTTIPISGDPLIVDAETHPNMNLSVRGYIPVNEALALVTFNPGNDSKAPQFPALFGDLRTPVFTTTYQAYRWDDDYTHPIGLETGADVTVLGMGTLPGETIYTPDSDYEVAAGGYEYLVMYAGVSDLTIHIGSEDEFYGYVLHIDGVCTDPDLLALYQQSDAAGRYHLPVLKGHQAFGKALSGEIQIAIRDWGGFLDPRSRNDWWQGR
jgi:hypothetical protein